MNLVQALAGLAEPLTILIWLVCAVIALGIVVAVVMVVIGAIVGITTAASERRKGGRRG